MARPEDLEDAAAVREHDTRYVVGLLQKIAVLERERGEALLEVEKGLRQIDEMKRSLDDKDSAIETLQNMNNNAMRQITDEIEKSREFRKQIDAANAANSVFNK